MLDGGFNSPGFEFHFRISCCCSVSFISKSFPNRQLGHGAPISYKLCSLHMKNMHVTVLGTSLVLKERAERSPGFLAMWKILFSSISLFKYLFNLMVKEYYSV